MSDTPTLDLLDARLIEYRKKHAEAIVRMRDVLHAGDEDEFRVLRRAIVSDRDIIGLAAISILVDET